MNLVVKDTNRLKGAIILSGNSMKTFAEMTGISRSYLSSVVSGSRSTTGSTANKISEALNKDTDYFFKLKSYKS